MTGKLAGYKYYGEVTGCEPEETIHITSDEYDLVSDYILELRKHKWIELTRALQDYFCEEEFYDLLHDALYND